MVRSRVRVLVATLSLQLLASLLPAQLALAAGGITAISIMEDGRARTWLPADGTFSVSTDNDGDGIVNAVRLDSPAGYPWGYVEVGAAPGQALAVGTYAGAGYPAGAHPYLFINDTGCDPTGSFEIKELVTAGESVVRFAASVTVICSGTTVSRVAELRYDSTIGLVGPETSPHDNSYNVVPFGDVVGGSVTDPVTVSVKNRGTASLDISAVGLTGTHPGSFDIVTDGCSGAALATSATCTVTVRATPPAAGGNHHASLTFTSNATRAFGESLWVNGLAATTLEITTPSQVGAFEGHAFTAQISPNTDITRAGSVSWYRDGEHVGNATFDSDGKAASVFSIGFGDHEVKAVYWPTCCPDPRAAPTEVTKTITGLTPLSVGLSSAYPNPVKEGTQMTFTATLSSSQTPASGTLRIRNVTAGTTLATTAVTSNQATLETPLVLLPVGTTKIVAEFVGDPAFVQATDSRDQVVIEDTAVDNRSRVVTPTTFYPVVDGYRDTMTVKGQAWEPQTVTIRIYDKGNRLVRTIALGKKLGPYSTTWNGRTTGGTLVAAGSYRVRQTASDDFGNTASFDTTISLSWRKVKWITTSITKAGTSYSSSARFGNGKVTRTSSFSGGLRLYGGSTGSAALARWAFTLKSGLAYKGLKLEVLGKSTSSSARGILAFAQDQVGTVVGPSYRWYARTGGVTGHVNDRVVLLDVEADGPMSGAFDVAKTRVTYTYAVWP